jgi:signal transduction histidine kinase
MELRRHAAAVEHPEVMPGPPWWTPWHAGLLFCGILLVALLTQLAYFRIRQWKADTIARERERLAHDIHDTMAQSFAGIGYQIQGIRHSIVCGDRVESADIAEQLSVAYQLVRKCHEEASRTIAMLGSRLTPGSPDLLRALTETAHKIGSDQIRTIAELYGNPVPLSLRLSDALLQIGREAIVNAVSHSEPTALRIVLSYQENSVELAVEDDGHGFDYTPDTAGFGIYGMQKKARDVGGSLQIVSALGGGTRVQVTAKLQHETPLQRILTRVRGVSLDGQLHFNSR